MAYRRRRRSRRPALYRGGVPTYGTQPNRTGVKSVNWANPGGYFTMPTQMGYWNNPGGTWQQPISTSPALGAPKPTGGTPAGAGQQAPASGPAGMPLDPTYDAQVAAAHRRFDLTTGDLGYQEQRVRQDYGFDDPSNPYSRAKMMERAYQQGQAGTNTSMAAQGQLYSGAMQTQLGEGTRQYNVNVDTARRSYADALQRLSQGRLEAAAGRDEALGGAEGERLERAAANRPEDPGEEATPQGQSTKAQLQAHPWVKRVRGIGGGRWRVRLKDGRLITIRLVNGQWKAI